MSRNVREALTLCLGRPKSRFRKKRHVKKLNDSLRAAAMIASFPLSGRTGESKFQGNYASVLLLLALPFPLSTMLMPLPLGWPLASIWPFLTNLLTIT